MSVDRHGKESKTVVVPSLGLAFYFIQTFGRVVPSLERALTSVVSLVLEMLSRREKATNFKPDYDIDIHMKVLAMSGQESSILTAYKLKVHFATCNTTRMTFLKTKQEYEISCLLLSLYYLQC
ncbi:hypothetical protein ZEAMMB73_Zm00001d031754 [Zea mays]|uniref:Uncharacterized protein n=1 Tax=Zea mays TaxID=4577 RepID=A0A1D6KL67_MAIZE|nr:hypothetical protein ZEAMMB73_Zm00001d031754 [Zea mays]